MIKIIFLMNFKLFLASNIGIFYSFIIFTLVNFNLAIGFSIHFIEVKLIHMDNVSTYNMLIIQ